MRLLDAFRGSPGRLSGTLVVFALLAAITTCGAPTSEFRAAVSPDTDTEGMLGVVKNISAQEGGLVEVGAPHPLAGVSVAVPPSALSQDTAITISPGPAIDGWRREAGESGATSVSRPLAGAAPALPAGVRMLGPVVEIGPSGLEFLAPVTIRLPYDEARLAATGRNEEEVGAVTLPSGAKEWKRLAVAARDAEANTITVEASHFSLFAPVTPSDLGCVWVLKFFIAEIDCGEHSTEGFISPFGDTDVDVTVAEGVISAVETHSVTGLPYILTGAGTVGGAVNFVVAGNGVSPGAFGGSVGSFNHVNATMNGAHDGFNRVSGDFVGGAVYTYFIDPGDPAAGTVDQPCEWSGTFTVDVVRAVELAASNGLETVLATSGAPLFACGSRSLAVTARPSAEGVPTSKVKYFAPTGFPETGSGESFAPRFPSPGSHLLRAGMCDEGPADAEMTVRVVRLRNLEVRTTADVPLASVPRGSSFVFSACPGDAYRFLGFSEAVDLVPQPGPGVTDPVGGLVQFTGPGGSSSVGTLFSATFESPGEHRVRARLCEDEEYAEAVFRVPAMLGVELSREELCPGELFEARITFDAPLVEDILSHIGIDRVLLGEDVDIVTRAVQGTTVTMGLRLLGVVGGGPRTLRFTCGAASVQTEFTKEGFASAVLRDLDDAGNVADVLAGQFSITTFLAARGPAWVKLDVTTEPAGKEGDFLFAFKPTNGVMPPDGAFQPAGVNVSFSEAGSFEIAAKCVRDEQPFMFGEGPRVNIVDLVSLTLRDLSTGREEVIARGTPPRMLLATPGAAVEARVATNPAGHEADVSFAILDAGGAVLDQGSFPAGGVLAGTAPASPVFVLAFADKDSNETLTVNVDPAVGGSFSPVCVFDYLRLYLDGEEYHADTGRANGREGEMVVVTGRGFWFGPDEGYRSNDDVDCGSVALTAVEIETDLLHEPGGGQASAVSQASEAAPATGSGGGKKKVFEITQNPDGSVTLLAVNAGDATVEFTTVQAQTGQTLSARAYFHKSPGNQTVTCTATVCGPVIAATATLNYRVEVTANATNNQNTVAIITGTATVTVAFKGQLKPADVTSVQSGGVAVAPPPQTTGNTMKFTLPLPPAGGTGSATSRVPFTLTLRGNPLVLNIDKGVIDASAEVRIVASENTEPAQPKTCQTRKWQTTFRPPVVVPICVTVYKNAQAGQTAGIPDARLDEITSRPEWAARIPLASTNVWGAKGISLELKEIRVVNVDAKIFTTGGTFMAGDFNRATGGWGGRGTQEPYAELFTKYNQKGCLNIHIMNNVEYNDTAGATPGLTTGTLALGTTNWDTDTTTPKKPLSDQTGIMVGLDAWDQLNPAPPGNVNIFWQILAHEFGHLLLGPNHPTQPGQLMFGTADAGNTALDDCRMDDADTLSFLEALAKK
ncbi:MAG: hypothetical protein HY719_04420 [Planctomycetes bacterium]|nr:hypothetical protein [Planctomycetota bacterium]